MSIRFKPKFNIKKGDTIVVIAGDDKDLKKPRKVLEVILEKGRVDLLIEVMDYVRIVYSHGDVVDVVLRTTFPLELDIVERIKDAVAVFAKKKVNLYLQLDPDLLGGVQIMIGNVLLDGSVRNRLMLLKKQLLQSRMRA